MTSPKTSSDPPVASSDPRDQASRHVRRIAHLLGVPPDELAALRALPSGDLAVFHDQVSHALFGDAQEAFAKVAGLAARIPGPLAGRLAERLVPPVIAARIAEALEPVRARDLVDRMNVTYLADIAVALDPVRSRAVVAVLPARRIGEVARELFARREYAVMAEFVDSVSQSALEAAFDVAGPRDLLQLTPLVQWTDRVDQLVAALPEAKVRRIADELDVAELADFAVALDPTRLGPVLAELDHERLVAVAQALLGSGRLKVAGRFADVVPVEVLDAVLATSGAAEIRAVRPHLATTAARDRLDAVLAADESRD